MTRPADRAAAAAAALDAYLGGIAARAPGHQAPSGFLVGSPMPGRAGLAQDGVGVNGEGPSAVAPVLAASAPPATVPWTPPLGDDPPPWPADPDWLFHHLDITGRTAEMAAFQAAAAGPGWVPWPLDPDNAEEDWVHWLLRPGAAGPGGAPLSAAGARALAGQLLGAVERRRAWVEATAVTARGCALDLHRLLPVPEAVLSLGFTHPGVQAWLWRHWGTPEPLRHVAHRPARTGGEGASEASPAGAGLHLQFWSASWSPWRALQRLRRDWPGLRFALRPHYDAG